MTYVEPGIAQAIDELDAKITELFGLPPSVAQPVVQQRSPTPAPQYVYPQTTGYPILLNYMRPYFGLTQLDFTIPLSQWRFDLEMAIYVADLAQYSQQIAISSQDGLTGAKSYTSAVLQYVTAGISQATSAGSSQAIGVAEALYNAAEGDIRNEGAARAAGDGRVDTHAYNYSRTALAEANAHADDIHHVLSADLASEGSARAAGDAHALAASVAHTNDLYNQTAARITTVHDTLQGSIDDTANRLELAVTNGVSTAESFATSAAAAASGAAVTQVLAVLQPTVTATKTAVDTCLEPLCDTVTPNAKQLGNLGKVLKTAADAGIAALLAGLVAAAIVDPQAAADDIVAAAGWMDAAAVDLVDAVGG